MRDEHIGLPNLISTVLNHRDGNIKWINPMMYPSLSNIGGRSSPVPVIYATASQVVLLLSHLYRPTCVVLLPDNSCLIAV